MAVLARVTDDVDGERGPDLAWDVQVPPAWFDEQAVIEVRLPRLLGCARCAGGGCDACDRKGAFSRSECGAPECVELTLPAPAGDGGRDVCLRLPGSGAQTSDEQTPPGHLLLTLRASPEGAVVDERVRRLATRSGRGKRGPGPLIWAGLAVSTILLALWLVYR